MINYYQTRTAKADYLQLEEFRKIEKHLKTYGYEQTKQWLQENIHRYHNPDKKIVRIILQPAHQTNQKIWNIEHKKIDKVMKYARKTKQQPRNTSNPKDQKTPNK